MWLKVWVDDSSSCDEFFTPIIPRDQKKWLTIDPAVAPDHFMGHI